MIKEFFNKAKEVQDFFWKYAPNKKCPDLQREKLALLIGLCEIDCLNHTSKHKELTLKLIKQDFERSPLTYFYAHRTSQLLMGYFERMGES